MIALISSSVSSMLAAATFCSTCSGSPEPGIGRTCGDRVSSQAGPAVSAVLAYRLATYWLPVIPGWAAWRLLQRRDYV